MAVEEAIRLTHVLTHPVRHSITKLLEEKKRLYIADISKNLGIDRKVVTFHLRVMEREGLLETSLESVQSEAGNPVMVRYAKLTKKAKETMKKHKL